MDARHSEPDALDPYLAGPVRHLLEERYWRPIEHSTSIGAFVGDAALLHDPARHPPLFADHAVVHVRDVANGTVELLRTVNGLLIPERSPEDLHIITTIGVMTAYLHDIGMVDPSPWRRRVHPQWAAQEVFTEDFDDIIELIIESGNWLLARIESLSLPVPTRTTLREVLAMTVGHSKSVVPPSCLADPNALSDVVRRAVFNSLDSQQDQLTDERGSERPSPAMAHYPTPDESFTWLTSSDPSLRAFAADVVDAVRALRAADALRQRGTTLRTSAGYEMFLDPSSADVVYAVRTEPDAPTVHLTIASPMSAGEAALRRTAVTSEGHLRVWFHRTSFADPRARAVAAINTARVIIDVQADVLPTFASPTEHPFASPPSVPAVMRIELASEQRGDSFAQEVASQLRLVRDDLAARIVVVDDELPTPLEDHEEHGRYRVGEPLDPHGEIGSSLRSFADAVSSPGVPLDVEHAFDGVRVLHLEPGDVLIRPGTAASFVYLPLQAGLALSPLGGYEPRPLEPWDFIGVTGVIRRGERNAAVRASTAVDVIAIPAEVFRRRWFRPVQPAQLAAVLAGLAVAGDESQSRCATTVPRRDHEVGVPWH